MKVDGIALLREALHVHLPQTGAIALAIGLARTHECLDERATPVMHSVDLIRLGNLRAIAVRWIDEGARATEDQRRRAWRTSADE